MPDYKIVDKSGRDRGWLIDTSIDRTKALEGPGYTNRGCNASMICFPAVYITGFLIPIFISFFGGLPPEYTYVRPEYNDPTFTQAVYIAVAVAWERFQSFFMVWSVVGLFLSFMISGIIVQVIPGTQADK